MNPSRRHHPSVSVFLPNLDTTGARAKTLIASSLAALDFEIRLIAPSWRKGTSPMLYKPRTIVV
jgi:hypothetical protein